MSLLPFQLPATGGHAHRRRGSPGVVASNLPSATGAATAPLTKEAMVQYLRSGCKPQERWRCVVAAARPRCGVESCVSDTCLRALSSIGTEHEKFGFRKSDKRPMDYQEIKHLLEGLVRRCVQPRASSSARTHPCGC
jgi:hypothetical protein